jgi:uncharacterized pyridoxamine 5'-phosphate oxidase family protein
LNRKGRGKFRAVLTHIINDSKINMQVMVMGLAQAVEDQPLKEKIVKAMPFLKSWIEKRAYESLKVFRMTGCRATLWTFDKNIEPKEYVDI